MVKRVICIGILLGLIGCRGTGFERKTSLLPDEISLARKIDIEDTDWSLGPQWTIGFKWKFK